MNSHLLSCIDSINSNHSETDIPHRDFIRERGLSQIPGVVLVISIILASIRGSRQSQEGLHFSSVLNFND